MSAREEERGPQAEPRTAALALLRERFPEPWSLSLRHTGDETRWFAEADRREDRTPTDSVRVSGFGTTAHMAACACVAAWDEATKAERSAVVSAARAITSDAVDDMAAAGHRAVDIALAALAAERALADRLGEALTELVRIEDLARVQCHCGGPAATCKMQRAIEAIAAWRAARGKA